eukprot:m.596544 g.596544  ORF g.596544 m.596544 type:complete len:496 (+) comp22412_c0_seq1:493-1980(+)
MMEVSRQGQRSTESQERQPTAVHRPSLTAQYLQHVKEYGAIPHFEQQASQVPQRSTSLTQRQTGNMRHEFQKSGVPRSRRSTTAFVQQMPADTSTETPDKSVAVPNEVLGGLMSTSKYGVTATLNSQVRLAKAVARVSSQKQQVRQLQTDKLDLEQATATAQAEKAQLAQQLAHKDTHLAKLVDELERTKSEKEAAAKEASALQQRLTQAADERAQAGDELQALNETIRELKTTNTAQQRSGRNRDSPQGPKRIETDDEIKALHAELAAARRHIDELTGDFLNDSARAPSVGDRPPNVTWQDVLALQEQSDRTFIAVYHFRPRKQNSVKVHDGSVLPELDLREGDVVTVHSEERDDGLYVATVRGRRGLIPASHVEPIDLSREQARPEIARQLALPSRAGALAPRCPLGPRGGLVTHRARFDSHCIDSVDSLLDSNVPRLTYAKGDVLVDFGSDARGDGTKMLQSLHGQQGLVPTAFVALNAGDRYADARLARYQ